MTRTSSLQSGSALEAPENLRRTLTLPWLVFYGLGVTVGAGIFALIGEIVRLAGDAAPTAFLIAGVIAAATGISYALLVSVFPRAAGEAVFVTRGLGAFWGRLTGLGVAITGIVSSAVVALSFAGYVSTLIGLPTGVLVFSVVVALAGVAWIGIRESVAFAAIITVLELGALLVVVVFGLPQLETLPDWNDLAGLSGTSVGCAPLVAAAVIAFFAFIGFEDIENLAEETVKPNSTVPQAILITLVLTVIIYVILGLIAVAVPGRDALTSSSAPMAYLYSAVTGFSGAPIAVLAAIAMINGILIQIVMSSRVLYGMANEGLVPSWFGVVDPRRKTPARATVFVTIFILVLALSFPLVQLAELTSLVTLSVFGLVNLSLFAIGRTGSHPRLYAWRYWGLFGASVSVGVLLFQLASGFTAGH